MSERKEMQSTSTELQTEVTAATHPQSKMAAQVTDGLNLRVSPRSSPKKLQKRASKRYWTVHFYSSKEAMSNLSGLTVASCNPTSEHAWGSEEKNTAHCHTSEVTYNQIPGSNWNPEQDLNIRNLEQALIVQVPDKMVCNSCSMEFQSRPDQKEHFKSDWHRYNLQRRLKGKTTLTEDEFEDVCGSVSSISGSDSNSENEDAFSVPPMLPRSLQLQKEALDSCDSETETGGASEGEMGGASDDAARKYPKIFFRNSEGLLVSVYRCVVHHKKVKVQNQSELISMVTNITGEMKWAILMCGGGHFAGAVFDREKLILHKTFHRYVVRAKRGTAQGTRDSQGNAPKSAGASIRRYNETALKEDIKSLLESWKVDLESCDRIFIRAPGGNKRIFLHGKSSPFSKEDERVRMIPFATRRPTLNEVRRVFEMLSSIECYGDESDIQDFIPIAPHMTYNPVLGQLEVTNQDPQKSRQRKLSGERSREASPLTIDKYKLQEKVLLRAQQLKLIEDEMQRDDLPLSSDGSISDTELVETMEIHSTRELQEFEVTRSPNRKNRRRRLSKHQTEPESDPLEEEKYHLKNSLFTACKTGDVVTLRNLLAVFLRSVPAVESPEKKSDNAENEHSSDCCLQHVLAHDRNGSGEMREQFSVRDTESDLTGHESNAQNMRVDKTENISDTDISYSPIPSDVSENSSENQIQKEHLKKAYSKTVCGSGGGISQSSELLSPVDTNEMLNQPIGDNRLTLLHIAAKEGHNKVIRILMDCGANPATRDKFGQTPYTSAKDRESRNEFRKFMGQYPERYDYKAAQIPSALTDDMEKGRKQKAAEKKKLQKRAKQERMKEKREEDAIKEAEEREKKRYLALSDREKRALAAEKRLLKNIEETGQKTPVLSRCFQCGSDMTGKVPFEYSDFKFCSPKCLKQHRMGEKKT
ncbi:ankyrin repeat and zinc finger domain-containing protein 1-like isoform X2 [Ostrea edulis]|uniref:ankyrin repeat and zinc finger domain-containing protein 1-like isoform X2 n=1 Tax=Ostrea edulis TaxID=37623 RepID=UPI0024AF3856|nr:ankyrin repeat and zinc finger domain-containing protein 1-like isoform X2 [Ostrea edulis]